jgi:hypothetical protein
VARPTPTRSLIGCSDVSPAELLAHLDQATGAAEARARQLREAGDRLRAALADAVGLLAEATPPEPAEPPRKRGRPPRGSTTSSRPNGALEPAAVAAALLDEQPRKRRRRTVYPPGLDERGKYLHKMRHVAGRADLAEVVEAGERSLLSAMIEMGWKRPRKAKVEPVAAAEPEPPEPVVAAPICATAHPEPEPPELLVGVQSSAAAQPEPEPPEQEPEPAKKRSRRIWAPSDIEKAVETVVHPERDQDGPINSPQPRDAALAASLDTTISDAQRAAAAIERHRQRRIANEPEVRWSPGAHAEW